MEIEINKNNTTVSSINYSLIPKINKYELISATKLINYIRSDCIIDYLDILEKNDYTIGSSTEEFVPMSKNKRRMEDPAFDEREIKKNKSSFDYIIDNGYKFENIIFEEIHKKMIDKNEIDKLIEISELDINIQYYKTVQCLLTRSHDIILGAVLINNDDKTFGYPDIIVSGYWLNKYISNVQLDSIKCDRSSYYIIDIKSSTIKLNSNGAHISNGIQYVGYKSQLYIYTNALNKILSNDKPQTIAFILGKKYNFTSLNKKISINSFGTLGICDFTYETKIGINFKIIIPKAIEWINELDKNWLTYRLGPINNDNLYPNMKNHYDKSYKKIKKSVAKFNNEITLIWYCGITNRNLAWNAGIKKYNDPNLTAKILGFGTNSTKTNILNSMLKLSHTNQNLLFSKSNNVMNWQKKEKYEFFVDFETYNYDNILDENIDQDYIENLNKQQIYMIGVGYYDNTEYKFKCFITKYSSNNNINKLINDKINKKCDIDSYIFCDGELDLIVQFVDFIYYYSEHQACRLIHWSNAEPIIFNKKILDYKLEFKYKLPWYDLLDIFKDSSNPIIIKECFGFGLKEIVNKLNEYSYIKIKWSDLDDGLLSSFIARDIYDNNLIKPSTETDSLSMIDIVEYNYIDCRALYELILWMRSYVKISY